MHKRHIATWTLMLAGAIAQAQPAPPIDASAFINGGGLESPRLSPDGARLAGMLRNNTLRALVTQNIDGSDRKVVFTSDKPDMDLDFVRWVANDRLLLRLTRSQGIDLDGQMLPMSRLLSIASDGTQPVAISPKAKENRPWINQQSQEAELACSSSPTVTLQIGRSYGEDFDLGTIDARTGKAMGAVPAERFQRWWADGAGETRLAQSQVDGKPQWWLRAKGANTFKPIDWPVLRAYPGWVVLGFDSQPHQVLVFAVRDGAGHVLRIDVNSPGQAETLASIPGTDANPIGLVRNQTTCQAVGLRHDAKTLLWGDNLAPFWGGLEQALPNATLDLVQWQGDRILVRMSGAGLPTRYLLGLRSARKLDMVAETYRQLPGDLGLESRQISAGSLKANWLQRADAKGPLPTVVCVACELIRTAGLGAYQPLAAYLAHRGFGVITVGYGTGDLPMLEATTESIRIDRLALAEVARLGWSDPQRVAVVAGHGRASWQAMALAADHQPPVRAVAVSGLVSDMGRYAFRDILGAYSISEDTKTSLRRQIRGATEAQLSAASPMASAATWQPPLLLLHAENDGRVSVSHSQRLADALQAAGKPVTLLRLANSTDDVQHPPYRAQVMKAIGDLLAPLLTIQP